tara:strand:- start:3246 stop:3917 length:672 start_codon:yes stop_codon:yes gene_type:complete
MKSNLQEEIANAMQGAGAEGANFANPQVGQSGNIAGMIAPLGYGTPTTKTNSMPERQTRNKKDQERISKLVALLMGRQLAPEELSEKKGGTSLAVVGGEGKAISGIGGQGALSLPPAKNVAVKPNKLTTGVNGFKTDTPVIARVVSDLIDAKQRFPSMNLDPARAAIDGNYVYKTKNVTNQADQYNTLRGIEMGSFFRSDEESTTDELVNDTLTKHFNKHTIR